MSTRVLRGERGYAMAALLVGMSVMAVAMSMLLPAWRTMAQREREAEFVFRGNQYARAIRLYNQARNAYPPDIDVLVREKFLRKKYKDPITNDDFQVVRFGQPLPGGAGAQPTRGGGPIQQAQQASQQELSRRGGPGTLGGSIGGGAIVGVVSKSTGTMLKVINGRSKYNEVAFTPTEMTQQGGTGGRGGNVPGGVRGGAAGGGRAGGRAGTNSGTPLGPGSGGRQLQLPGQGGARGFGRGTQPPN